MSKDDYKIAAMSVRSKNAIARCSDKLWLDAILSQSTEAEYKLTRFILTMGQIKCILDKEVFDGEAQFKQMYLSIENKKINGRKISFKAFEKLGKDFYKNCLGGNSKDYANILFEVTATGIVMDKFKAFRDLGLLPLTTFDHNQLKYSACANTLGKLKSYEDKRKEHESNILAWIRERQTSKLDHLDQYDELLGIINNADDRKALTARGFRKFQKRWMDRETESGRIIKGLRSKMISIYDLHGPSFEFGAKDKNHFYYGPNMLNAIYRAKELWYDNDIIGEEQHVNLFARHHHFQRDLINITTPYRKGTVSKINLGDNHFKYKMEQKGKSLIVTLMSNDVKFYVDLSHHKDLRDFEILTSDNKKGKYGIRFASDSGKKVYYNGLIKEPCIRIKNGSVILGIPISCCFVEGASPLMSLHVSDTGKSFCPYRYVCVNSKKCDGKYKTKIAGKCIKADESQLWQMQTYFKSAPEPGKKDKFKLPFEEFTAMGVDLGIYTPFAAAIDKVKVDDNQYGLKLANKQIIIRSRAADQKKVEVLSDMVIRMLCTIQLIGATRRYVLGSSETISEFFFIDNGMNVDWSDKLKINYNEYMSQVKELPSVVSDEKPDLVRTWASKDTKWMVKNIVKSFHDEFFAMRRYTDKVKGSSSGITQEDYEKLAVTKIYIDLQKAFSDGAGICQSAYKYLDGMRRKISNFLASDIINVALANGVKIIFIEDLDSKPSLYDDTKENWLKSLWGAGELKKWITLKAQKHGIVVVSVEPSLTSRIDYKTNKIGYRKGRKLYLTNGTNVDADENAAKNILRRGIYRHADLPEFFVDQIGEKQYRMSLGQQEFSQKRLIRSAKMRFGSKDVIFEHKSGELIIAKSKLTKADLDKTKINKKKTYAIVHGKSIRLRHELEKELKSLLPNTSL